MYWYAWVTGSALLYGGYLRLSHRLYMEVDLPSLFWLHVTWCAHTVTRPYAGFRHPDRMAPESSVRGRENDCFIWSGNIKAVNRGDKRTWRVRDRDFVKLERSRRYRDRYRCQEKKSRRGRARDPVFRDPPTRRTSSRSLFADRDPPPPALCSVPEFIDPVFAKTSPIRSFLVIKNTAQCFLFILHFKISRKLGL